MSIPSHLLITLSAAICALSPSSENCYIAYPSRSSSSAPFNNGTHQGGQGWYATGDVEVLDALSLQLVNIVQAHKSPVSHVVMNSEGTLLATASEKVIYQLALIMEASGYHVLTT